MEKFQEFFLFRNNVKRKINNVQLNGSRINSFDQRKTVSGDLMQKKIQTRGSFLEIDPIASSRRESLPRREVADVSLNRNRTKSGSNLGNFFCKKI